MSSSRELKHVWNLPTVSLRRYTVKVNHIPLSVSKQQLKALFDTYGSCEVHLRHQYGHKEQHAFVNYASQEAAQAAVKLNGTALSGGKITVKLQGAPCTSHISPAVGNFTVKVENLSKKTTEETLDEIFGFFGDIEVVSVRINTPANSPFNYAYVNYSYMQDAQRAVQELNGNKIHGSIMKVKIHNSIGTQSTIPTPFTIVRCFQASPPPRRPFTYFRSREPTVPALLPIQHCTFTSLPIPPQHGELPTLPPPSLNMHGRFAAFPPPPATYYGRYAIPPAEQPHGVVSKPPLSSTVKVTIHGHLTGDDLETIFDQFGTMSTKPNIISGTPNFAYINFESPDQAQVAALTMHQQKIKGIQVDVKVKRDNRRHNAPPSLTSSHDYEQIDCAPLVVQVITSADMSEYKIQLQEIESSTSVKVMPMKSGNRFNISGKQERLMEAVSLLKDVISRAQEKLVEDYFTVPCHCVPLFTNHGTIKQITRIEQKHCVEFVVNGSGAQEAVDISTFSRLIGVKFASHTDSPPTVESVSRYLCASTSKESEQSGADSADFWEWQDDDGRFKLYEPEKCEDFSLKFQQDPTSSFACSIVTKLGLKEYSINFKNMLQTNILTETSRQIQRQSMRCSATWYYTDDKGDLVPYTKRQSCEIENAYRSGNKTLTMNINGK